MIPTRGERATRFAPLARLCADREPVPNPVAIIRAVVDEITEQFVAECPHVTRGTFSQAEPFA